MGPSLVHDHLLAGSNRLHAWSRRNSPPIPGKHSRHPSNGAIAVPVAGMSRMCDSANGHSWEA
jgi:hypothetical protein